MTRNHLKSFAFFRLPLFDHPNALALVSKMKMVRGQEKLRGFATIPNTKDISPKLDVNSAVFHDTLLVLAEAVKSLNFEAFLQPTQVSCDEERSWESGATFYNYINAVETEGITGKIRFKV